MKKILKYKHLILSIFVLIAGLAYVLASAYFIDYLGMKYITIDAVLRASSYIIGVFSLLFAIVSISRHFFKI